MKKYLVTVYVAQTREIEAADDQDAHNRVTNMVMHARHEPEVPPPFVHSIVEVEEPS